MTKHKIAETVFPTNSKYLKIFISNMEQNSLPKFCISIVIMYLYVVTNNKKISNLQNESGIAHQLVETQAKNEALAKKNYWLLETPLKERGAWGS